jgi:hypothetical protein
LELVSVITPGPAFVRPRAEAITDAIVSVPNVLFCTTARSVVTPDSVPPVIVVALVPTPAVTRMPEATVLELALGKVSVCAAAPANRRLLGVMAADGLAAALTSTFALL